MSDLRPLFMGSREVEEALDWQVAADSQRRAFEALSRGDAVNPPKLTLPGAPGKAWTLCYAARVSPGDGVAAKLVSVAEENPTRGLPLVQGVVVLIDPETGSLVGLLDGAAVTTRRTAAASAVATAALARPGADGLAILGSGVQAVAHAEAILALLPTIKRVRLYSRRPENRERAAMALQARLKIDIAAAASGEEAVHGSAIVVTCTHTEQPVVSGEWIERGATVVTIGSYTPERCEVDDSLLRSVDQHVVDHRESALRHAGTLRRALDLGLLTESDLVEIGDVLLGRVAGRRSPDDVILYTSVGVGVQDAAAAWAALRRARKEGGTAEET